LGSGLIDRALAAGRARNPGFSRKLAQPALSADGDVLLGTLDCGPVQVAAGTMGCRHGVLDISKLKESL